MNYDKIIIIFFVFVNFEFARIKTTTASISIEMDSNNSLSNCNLTNHDDLLCQGNNVVPFNMNTVLNLFNFSNLRKLRLVKMNIGEFDLSTFDDTSENIAYFAIEECRFTSISFTSNQTWKKLHTFVFTGNFFGSVPSVNFFWSPLILKDIAPNLKTLNLTGNKLNRFESEEISLDFSNCTSILNLDLSNNGLTTVPRLPVNLLSLNLTANSIAEINSKSLSTVTRQLKDVNFSYNKLRILSAYVFTNVTSLERLDFSHNVLTDIDDDAFANLIHLKMLDLSDNHIKVFKSSSIQLLFSLRTLILRNNPIENFQHFPRLNVQFLDLSQNEVEVLHMDKFVELKQLKTLLLENSRRMRSIVGNVDDMSSLGYFSVKNSSVKYFPTDFFRRTKKLSLIDISNNPFPCDCRLLWLSKMKLSMNFSNYDQTFCLTKTGDKMLLTNVINIANFTTLCSLGMINSNGTTVRANYGTNVLLDCGAFGDPIPKITWRRADVDVVIPQYGNDSKQESASEGRKYIVFADGTMTIMDVDRSDIGVYQCTIDNEHGNATVFMLVRLSYAENWWYIKVASVFCGILTALGFFALNMIYSAIRRLIIWRLSEMEQTSRVRCLLESMEKYRQRQMDGLHDIYASNINQVRDNYHQQVEQLRKSYSAQAERFRDYRTAQMETVAHHIDSLRDNYANQVNRMRDYGSKQMERLWESYQSRVNRLRDFSLHQRLRLMRQYKVKQRYLNKLLETLNVESCRNPSRQNQSIIIGPELIELPRILPDDDLPTSSTFDTRDDFLSLAQSPYLDRLRQSSSKCNMFIQDDEGQDFDDDASSYHSFPEETTSFVENENVSREHVASDVQEESSQLFSLPKIHGEPKL